MGCESILSKNVGSLREDHGQIQLMKMVAPHPELQQCIDSFLFIKQWIIAQFNGASIDQPIFWMDQAPYTDSLYDFNACHVYPTTTQEAQVWVRPFVEPMEFIAYLCFEFYNIRSYQLFNELDHDAKTFRCSKDEYILQFAQLEFQAAHQTARFYQEKIASYLATNNITNQGQWWYVYMPVRFDEWKDVEKIAIHIFPLEHFMIKWCKES